MKYLLDTDICIYIANEKRESVRQRLERTRPANVVISVITLAELQYGAEKSARPEQNRKRIELLLAQIRVLDFAPGDARVYGNLRAALERRGEVVGANDLLIASQALNQNLIMVTNNEREFRRIPQLKIENWAG